MDFSICEKSFRWDEGVKLWWSGNNARFGGVGVLVDKEISGNVVKVRKQEAE